MPRHAHEQERARDACLIVAVAVMSLGAALPPAVHAELPTDEVHRLRRVLNELSLPELAEPLTPANDLAAREALAAAYAVAGSHSAISADRNALLRRAEALYAELIAARQGSDSRGESDRLALARCRVAAASIILRCALLPDLDRFEITCGLAAPRERLLLRLDQCAALYAKADAELAELAKAMSANEERFLLLGLADPLRKLHCECLLNLAWAQTWRAAVEDKPAAAVESLTQAVRRFDSLPADAPTTADRQGARLGMAVALRLLRRCDDSLAVLDKLEQEQPDYATAVRTRYERGRTLLAAGRFAEARAALQSIAVVNPRDVPEAQAAARFYIMLAPALIGDSFLREAGDGTQPPAQRDVLAKQGLEALTALAARGGEWPEIVDTYLAARGIHRDRADRTAAELAAAAQRAMAANRYADAAPLWQAADAKAPAGHARTEARYNLAVCRFQTGRMNEAAEVFDAVARAEPVDALSEAAAAYAYHCRAQVARQTHAASDWSLLAAACRLLTSRFSKHADCGQAAWIEPLALREAHRYVDAVAAFERVAAGSPHYWEARRSALACRQADLESRPGVKTSLAAPNEWSVLADAWRQLAADIEAAVQRGDARVAVAEARDAELTAADLLASDSCRRYRDSLTMLAVAEGRGDLPAPLRSRILAIRIRCQRGLGQFEQAAAVLDEYLRAAPADQAGEVLTGLSAGMEAEVDRLAGLERGADARRVAQAAVPTLRQLLAWVEKQPGRAADIPVVRLSLIHMMEQAGRTTDALTELGRLIRVDPANGVYRRRAARLTEQLARAGGVAERSTRLAEAEKLWAELLSDTNLRTTAPDAYWEARYHWLRLRCEAGHGDEVARGIAAEQAWYPALGGAPWQGRLLELADQARRQAQRGSGP